MFPLTASLVEGGFVQKRRKAGRYKVRDSWFVNRDLSQYVFFYRTSAVRSPH
ncbi:hypothetical protein ES703_44571 [subsurface metagenome]